MNTTFIKSKNSKNSDPGRLMINLSDKINLKRNNKCIPLSNLRIYYTSKNLKKSYKNKEI